MKSKLLRFLMVGAVLVSIGFSAAVQAIPITGTINMGGSATADNGDLTLATQFLAFGSPTPVTVTAGTGAYSAVPTTTIATWTPFFWIPPTGSTPVIPLWTFTVGSVTYSFDLTTLGVATSGSFLGSTFLVLNGTGVASISGGTYNPTFGNWSLTAVTGGEATFAFSSSTAATGVGVPDGGTSVILLGIALSSLGFLRSLSKRVA
jgi:hypothetical protein